MSHPNLEYEMDEWTYRKQVTMLIVVVSVSLVCSYFWFYTGASIAIGLAVLMFDTRNMLRAYLKDSRYEPKYRKFAIMMFIGLTVSTSAAVIGGFVHYLYR